MTVKEFCKANGLKHQTVYKKIAHHKNKELAGHITKIKGESIDLDDYAADFLLPIKVKILQAVQECEAIALENDELKGKLDVAEFNLKQAKDRIVDITAESQKLTVKITELTADLSDKSNLLSELKERNEQLENIISNLTEENSTLKSQLDSVPKLFRKNS